MYPFIVCGLLFLTVNIYARPGNSADVNVAAEARRLVHQANWASVATILSEPENLGYPMANLLSTSDSQIGADSTGEIFFYMMSGDKVARDIKNDNRITFMFSDAQEGECNERNDDPWPYTCPRTMISGQVRRLEKGSDEHTRGSKAFLSRHPSAAKWPQAHISDHDYYLCKLDITDVMVLTIFGYRHTTIEKYIAGTDAVNA